MAGAMGGIQGDPEGNVHHICTDKNMVSDANGGPWTPRFEWLFAKAGMKLSDPANLIRLKGHEGPHPQAYHDEVFRRLQLAMARCRGQAQCRDSLVSELAKIARDLVEEGSKLRQLVMGRTGK
ncbi:AHH domain-containing protein [Myxococcus sp. K15C18031901]|nr:AHH domain-containing protein [Myxococcus dinghuensis]MCP3100532.1 AHH domain-containing protein [Myxococcus dinghuensis]